MTPSLGVACPRGCGGEVTERRSKRGKPFFGCSTWPACDFVSWDRPRNEPCPDCGGTWLVEAISRRAGPVLACPDKGCGSAGRSPPARPERFGSLDTLCAPLVGNSAVYSPTRPHMVRAFPTQVVERQR